MYTILAPVYFMENLFNPWNLPMFRVGALPSPIPVGLPLQQLAIADLARFAALAIERPDEFAGRRIRIASDELTAEYASRILSRVAGREVEAEQLPAEQLPPPLRALFGWLELTGHSIDLGALHHQYPEVAWHDHESWLRSPHARLQELCPPELAAADRTARDPAVRPPGPG